MIKRTLQLSFAFLVVLSVFLYGFYVNDIPNTVGDGSSSYEPDPADTGITCSGGVIRDDNTYENGYAIFQDSSSFVHKLRPASFPYSINAVCVAWTRTAAGPATWTYDLVIYDTTGPGGTPGTLLALIPGVQATNIAIYPQHSRYRHSLSTAVNVTGAVYVGVRMDNNPSTAIYISVDENGTANGSGYGRNISTYPPVWSAITTLPNFSLWKNFGIRIEGTAGGPAACNFVWTAQVSGVTTLLQSVDAINEDIGWTAGNAATVRRTTNGGTTWLNANPNPGVILGDIYNIVAIDANTALVTTSGASTFIYRTSNGGTNWTQVHTLAGGFINAIVFVNAITGYATGDPVGGFWEFLKSTNGGVTWVQQPTALAQVGTEAGWNNSFSVVGDHLWWGTNQSKVYHSANGGLTWTTGATTGLINSYGLDFISPTTGLVVGPSSPFMQKTLNGGTTYTTVAALPAGTGTPFVTGAGTNFWAARGNTISRSTNNGDAWTTSFTGTGTFQHIDVEIDINYGCPTGWAVTTTGGIYKMTGTLVGISGNNNELPKSYSLMQNYPNPFNPTTMITFNLPNPNKVSLVVYDLLGREIATLVNDFRQAGTYTIEFNASNLASGVYLYSLKTGDFTDTKKMLLVK